MRCLALTLICLAACSGPTRKGETEQRYESFASVSTAPQSVTVETETAPSLALLAETSPSLALLTEIAPSLALLTEIAPSLALLTEIAPSLALLTEIDRMAARVDMLRLQQSDPRALTDVQDPLLQHRLLLRQLAAFDLRLMKFAEAHPQLDPSALERFQRLVREPFRELQARADE